MTKVSVSMMWGNRLAQTTILWRISSISHRAIFRHSNWMTKKVPINTRWGKRLA